MQLEFILCGSPGDAFWSQLAMFRRSLDSLGAPYRDARMAFYYGADRPAVLPNRWRRHFHNIEIHAVPLHQYLQDVDGAQAEHAFRLLGDHADLSILCDADTILVRPLPAEFLDQLTTSSAICGVIAHMPPPTVRSSTTFLPEEPDSELMWQHLAEYVLGRTIPLDYTYSLPPHTQVHCPFYINNGFIAGTPFLLKRLYGQLCTVGPRIWRVMDNAFHGQVGVPLAVERGDLPRRALPMRFNFPNDPLADALYPDELNNVVLIHYLRTKLFDRHKIFADPNSFAAFMNAQLDGSNKVFQTRIAHLTGGEYPFS